MKFKIYNPSDVGMNFKWIVIYNNMDEGPNIEHDCIEYDALNEPMILEDRCPFCKEDVPSIIKLAGMLNQRAEIPFSE